MHLTKDKKFWVPDKDYYSRWGAKYEQSHFNFTMKHISERDVALDCGGHVGIWSKRLSFYFNTVFAFEPIPKHIECHKANCTASNIFLHEVALSDTETTLNMKMGTGRNSGRSTLEYNSKLVKGDNSIISVSTKTLDSFELPKVDFMKIDVEKHEVKLLNGAIETLMRCKPIIFIEDHNHFYGKVPNGVEVLYSMGYEMERYLGSYNYLLKPTNKFLDKSEKI
jgi:FkbM family methyltransferase